MTENKLTKKQMKKIRLMEEMRIKKMKRDALDGASEIEDQFCDIPVFRKYNKNGLNIEIRSYKHAPDEYKDYIFNLTKKCMFDIYEQTNGWDDKIKKRELFENESRYLIAFDISDGIKPVGFMHYRFELEMNELSLYIYELNIEEEYRRKGLGKYIVMASEFIALKRGMEMVLLTIHKNNIIGVSFLQALHYEPHPTSPEIIDPFSNEFYCIKHKQLHVNKKKYVTNT